MEVSKNIVMKKISEIKPYIRNPRKNDKTVELLVDIIPKVGFNVPIVIDKKGIIVKGHSRYKAAIKLGMKEVPCIVTEADEEAIKLDRIADNRISEFSEWTGELGHELDMLQMDFSNLEFELPNDNFFEFENDYEEEAPAMQDNSEKYKEYLAQQEAKTLNALESQIKKAEEKQLNVPQTKKYYKVVCEHCGKTMFIDANLCKPLEVEE